MSTRINAATVLETLEKLEAGSDAGAKVTDSFHTLIGFAAKAGPAAMVATLPGISGILATAAACALAAEQVIKFVADRRAKRNELPPYERFQVLFYTTCYQAYLEALNSELGELEADGTAREDVRQEIAERVKEVERAEVTYLLCVDPYDAGSPLYEALDHWLTVVLVGLSVDTRSVARKVSDAARKRLRVLLARQTPEAAWMRDYLALGQQERTSEVLTTLAAVSASLKDWTEHASGGVKQRYQIAWNQYAEDLKQLPDLKETMFAETFGVRRVFIAPRAKYRVVGMGDESRTVDDLPALLGALLSERIPADDLRILCGGPGSGKSTLCRMLASELAADPAMHPVFLRLRHMKEGADVLPFVEENMKNEGLIDRISDLRDVPNLVLILDGFDELVMASQSRLRAFFNRLQEDLATGPLRSTRVIVSGRDTLFPGGDGLPLGAHVLTLEPFDRSQIAEWGKKWRALHGSGPGCGFTPEGLLPDDEEEDEEEDEAAPTPLQHLVSWPLTLHLLARVHAKGTLPLNQDTEKAFLYRSIMADTAWRQTMQTSGQGRFDRAELRRFMRLLAWEMYRRETDSLEHSEIMPLIRRFYPEATEADAAELTQVAIVNAPELTKGEETGCEFVHKSFSEYLAAEHIAETIERTAHKVTGYGAAKPTWHLSESDTTAALASVFASRLVTPEVQEMFEPMLGCAQAFFGDISLDDIRASLAEGDSLPRIIDRLESMLGSLAEGKHVDLIARAGAEEGQAGNPFTAYANYCAGIMIAGTAAARRASTLLPDQVYFQGEPFYGAFWQCIGILQAGGLYITDRNLGPRLFAQMMVDSLEVDEGGSELKLNEIDYPVDLMALRRIRGYRPSVTLATDGLVVHTADSRLRASLSGAAESMGDPGRAIVEQARREFSSALGEDYDYYDDQLAQLHAAGIISYEATFYAVTSAVVYRDIVNGAKGGERMEGGVKHLLELRKRVMNQLDED